MKKTHQLIQGTEEWSAHRQSHMNASDASAVLGISKYKSRSALLREKATGVCVDYDQATLERFAKGHEYEAIARPWAEEIIGTELFPVVMSKEVDGLPLSASFDGIDLLDETTFEHKTGNAFLLSSLSNGVIPEEYEPQIEQGLLISGAKQCLFMASSGNKEEMRFAWYESKPELRAKLIANWKQFAEDLANYQHVEKNPAVVADAIEDLPALTVEMVGQVTASNLDAFESAVKARIQAISTDLVTDADFANADKMVKFLGDGEKRLELVKAQALAQTASIDQLFRTIDVLREEMRAKRLALDKLVKAEKENRKAEIVTEARAELMHHVTALNKRIGISTIEAGGAIFAEAIKGLKSLDSMRDKVSVALANAKIEANAIADRIDANRKAMGEHASLFPDFATVCTKAPDDFAALVALRVSQQREADEKRLAAEREKIRAEEEAKAKREAEQKFEEQHAAFNEHQCRAEAAAVREMLYPKQEDTGQTMNLGQINSALGFTVTADFLSRLGINPVHQEKAAKLYEAAKMATICRRIQEHLTNVMQQALGGKAA